MKILSLIFTVALLVLAWRLASDLAKADCLPVSKPATQLSRPVTIP